MAKKKSKKNNKKRIIELVLLASIVTLIIYVIYSIISLAVIPTEVFMVQNDTISQEESSIGYVIREEKIAKGNSYQNGMEQIKSEGEKVAKGDNIFRYYSSNEEGINEKIAELNSQIQEALNGQTDLFSFSSDINAINNQIDEKIQSLKEKNDIQEIKEYKTDIDKYILKKSKIAGELSASNSYINGLIEQKNTLDNELKSNSEYVIAPMSGVVSYRTDNLEEILSPNSFETINEKFLDDLNLKTGQIVSTNSEFGKVINNYECYIACVLKSEEARQAQVGDKVELRLSTQDLITAKIDYKNMDGNNVIIVFKISSCVEKLIDYRKISFDIIWWDYEGLKIPKSAIYYDNGLAYVVRNRGGYLNKILIKILKESDTYSIVDNYDSDELKTLGYSTNEIINMRKINMYDEIVINPNIEKVE